VGAETEVSVMGLPAFIAANRKSFNAETARAVAACSRLRQGDAGHDAWPGVQFIGQHRTD